MNAAVSAGITAIVLAHNEERVLGDCLASLEGWIDEIFVVDSGSTDETIEIARGRGAQVVGHPFEDYAEQRNWALEHLPVRTEWILNIDADERVTEELQRSIRSAIAASRPEIVGYMVARRTVFLGRPILHGGHYPVWHLRLFRRGRGWCERRRYDQHFMAAGRTERLAGDLVDVVAPDVATLVRKHVRWAELEAEEQRSIPSASRLRGRLFRGNPIERRRWLREWYGRAPLFVRAAAYFLYRYVLRGGFLDGREGLIFHLVQGFFYRFLVDALLWESRRDGDRGRM